MKIIGTARAVGILVLLSACDKDIAQELILTNETIASTARAAESGLAQGHISPEDACRIEVYGRFAGAAVDQAWVSYVLNDPSSTQEQLDAARSAIAGVLPEAQALADEDPAIGSQGAKWPPVPLTVEDLSTTKVVRRHSERNRQTFRHRRPPKARPSRAAG